MGPQTQDDEARREVFDLTVDHLAQSCSGLLACFAHELRSPLTSVQGFTATMSAHWEQFTDEQKRFMVETINTDAGRIARLIGDLLDLSRLEVGSLPLHPVPLDAVVIAQRQLQESAGGEVARRRITLRHTEGLRVLADPDRFAQVLDILVDHALHHCASTVAVTLRPGSMGMAQVSVVESGASSGAVMGLGLGVVCRLLEAHGGRCVVSTDPEGCRVDTWWPVPPPGHFR